MEDTIIPRETFGNLSTLLEGLTTATEANNEVSTAEVSYTGPTSAEIRFSIKPSPVRPRRKKINM